MSIFDKGKDWVKHKAKQGYDKTVGKAEHEAKKGVDAIKDPIEELVEEVKHLTSRMDWAGRVITSWRDKLQLDRVVPELTRKVDDIPNQVSKTVHDEVEKWINGVAKALTKEGLEKFRDALKAAKEGMDKLEDRERLIDQINALSISFQLGPVTLDFANFYDRVDTIIETVDAHIDKPPSLRRTEILKLIETLGPTTIDLGISANFALGVGSKELGVGFSLGGIPLALFTEIADAILDACGVPD